MIQKLKTIEQIKNECLNYEITNNGSIKLYYPERKGEIVNHLYIHEDMIKDFGKLIKLLYSKDNRYFEYTALNGWNYSEKWLEPNEFLSDDDFKL